jgi:predicted acylesterase/phospholipase RssA
VHGAYEVGVLKAFTEFLDPIDINYDYISGVSIGAVNTAIFAMYPPG